MLLPQLFFCGFLASRVIHLLFVRSLVLLGLWWTFLASSPLFSWDTGSSSLSIFWILLLEVGCIHFILLFFWDFVWSLHLGHSAFSPWLTFCNVVFVLAVGLQFFLLLLSTLWWRWLRGSYVSFWWEALAVGKTGSCPGGQGLAQ